MTNSTIYWLGFIGYSLLVIWMGFSIWFKKYKKRQSENTAGFWSANKSLSSWAVGLSISASMMSISWSCVYGVQLFYWYGLGAIWLLIVPWLVTMIFFYLLAPKFRTFNIFSQPELLQKRFGATPRILLAFTLIIVFITWGGAEVYAAGNIIAPLLGVTPETVFLLIAVVVGSYSFMGGFAAVVSTDKIQFLLVALFISTIALLGYNAIPSEQEFNLLIKGPKSVGEIPLFSTGFTLIILTFFIYLPGWLIESDLWLRIQAAKSNSEARKGVALSGLTAFIFVGIMPLIIGLSSLILFPATDGVIPEKLNDGALIFSVIMTEYAPVWLNLLLSVGLIAAAMSTIDTCGNIVALSISNDLLEPWFKRIKSRVSLNLIARLSSVGAIFICYIYALFTESLWDIFYLSSGILTTTVFIPIMASFFSRFKLFEIKVSLITGLVSTILFYFLEKFNYLDIVQPSIVLETGLGYIVLAFLFTALLFFISHSISYYKTK